MRKTYVLVGALMAGLIMLGAPPVVADKGGEKQGNKHGNRDRDDARQERRDDRRDKDDDGRREKHDDRHDRHDAQREKDDDKLSPRDLSRAEREELKDGRPPGWSRGVKRGWEGKDCPPGLAKKGQCPEARPAAVSHPHAVADPWRDGLERLRRWGRDERRLPPATLDAVLVSFEGAVRHGVPAPMAERLVMTAAQRGVSPQGIEAITRAVAYGAGHGASLEDLEAFADHGLNRGVTADAIALGIYRLSTEKR